MNLLDAMDVTAAGMAAQRVRINVVSSNIANAHSTRSADGGPYRRRDVVLGTATPAFDEMLQLKLGGPEVHGVQADAEPPRMLYSPNHPDANGAGYVAMPNVNVMEEMADMVSSARTFEANSSVFGTLKAMILQALRLGKE